MSVLRLIAKWLFAIALFHGLGMLLAADFMRDFTSFMFDPYIDLWSVHGDTFAGALSISNLLATYQALPDAGKIICWLLIASTAVYGFMNALRLSQIIAAFFIALLAFQLIMWGGNVRGFAWPQTSLILYAVASVAWLIVLALGSGGTLRARLVDVWRRFTT